MNPFDLTGPQFLTFFLALAIFVSLVVAMLRWRLSQVDEPWQGSNLPEDAYQIAFLVGGWKRVCEAALVTLYQRKCLATEGAKFSLRKEMQDPHPVEATVCRLLGHEDYTAPKLRKALRDAIPELRQPLEEQGLVVSAGREVLIKFLSSGLFFCLTAVGVIKVGVGFSRGKPIEILFFLTVVAFFVTLILANADAHCSNLGSRALKLLRRENAALKDSSILGSDASISSTDIALAVALFSTTILPSELSPLRKMLNINNSSSGCGSSGCGGGCGGGGCGGCGG